MVRFIVTAAALSALLASVNVSEAATAGPLTFGNVNMNTAFGISDVQNNAWAVANSIRGGSTGTLLVTVNFICIKDEIVLLACVHIIMSFELQISVDKKYTRH